MSRTFNNINAFVLFLRQAATTQEQHMHEGLEKTGLLVEKAAKAAIGHYGDNNWQQLAESTQADRSRKGFAPNDPLLRTGEMRDSISHHVSGHIVTVGSDSNKAMWQELGTNRIPPRPFIVPAMHKHGEEAARDVAHHIMKPLIGS